MACQDKSLKQTIQKEEFESANDVGSIPDELGISSKLDQTETLPKTNENSNSLIDDSNSSNNIMLPKSKKKLKRELKHEKYLKMRAENRSKRKLKNKERRKLRNQNMPSETVVEKPKLNQMADSSNKFSIVIDFSYDELMSPKDLTKCGNQVVRCYSANRRSSNPVQLHFCNFAGKIREEMSKCYEFGKWDIHFHENSYLEVFKKEDLVYLTSESRNVLESLEENKVYIIGGLVDHNAHKGVSYRKAVCEGIAHAQLPIRKHIQMKSRSVLTINHVFEILLKVTNGELWPTALRNAVPQRYFETGYQISDQDEKESAVTNNAKARSHEEAVPSDSCDMALEVN